MTFRNPNATVYYPAEKTLAGVTDLCIAAHQDDIEIMAYGAIAACYEDGERVFCGAVLADGAGSPRSGEYAAYTDEQMKAVRISEQQKAAQLGRYRAVIQFAYPSSVIKDPAVTDTTDEIYALLMAVRPHTLYTHNIADKHETHVATALRVIAAVRKMPPEARPKRFVGLEVWRGLDWLPDEDKVCLDTSAYPALQRELLQVHRSQVVGGKAYDDAAVGRRLANATFYASHATDACQSMNFGIDYMPMIEGGIEPKAYINSYLEKLVTEVNGTLEKLWKK